MQQKMSSQQKTRHKLRTKTELNWIFSKRSNSNDEWFWWLEQFFLQIHSENRKWWEQRKKCSKGIRTKRMARMTNKLHCWSVGWKWREHCESIVRRANCEKNEEEENRMLVVAVCAEWQHNIRSKRGIVSHLTDALVKMTHRTKVGPSCQRRTCSACEKGMQLVHPIRKKNWMNKVVELVRLTPLGAFDEWTSSVVCV